MTINKSSTKVFSALNQISTSTRASVLRLGDKVGFTPLAANTSSGVLSNAYGQNNSKMVWCECVTENPVNKTNCFT